MARGAGNGGKKALPKDGEIFEDRGIWDDHPVEIGGLPSMSPGDPTPYVEPPAKKPPAAEDEAPKPPAGGKKCCDQMKPKKCPNPCAGDGDDEESYPIEVSTAYVGERGTVPRKGPPAKITFVDEKLIKKGKKGSALETSTDQKDVGTVVTVGGRPL